VQTGRTSTGVVVVVSRPPQARQAGVARGHQRPDAALDLLLRVLGRKEDAQPRRAFRHHREQDRLHVHPRLEQRRRHPRRRHGAAEHHRHDAEPRRVPGVEPRLARAAEEQRGVVLQARHAPGLGAQDAERFQRRGRQRRRQPDRIHEARRRVPQKVHQRTLAGDVAAAGRERL
jgi:hypothetical protein